MSSSASSSSSSSLLQSLDGRVLLTGATGFVGGHVLRVMLAQGVDVAAFARSAENVERMPDGVNVVEGDLLDQGTLAACVEGVSVVVHCAAVMEFFPKSDEHVQWMHRVNVDGTRNLVQASLKAGVKRFVYISSTEAMGSTSPMPASEDEKCYPDYEYGRTKVRAEAAIKQLTRHTPMSYIILRPSGLYGPGDFYACYQVMEAVWSGLLFFVPGTGKKRVMFTHIDDCVEAVMLAATSKLPSEALNQTYNICPNESISFGELIATMSRLLNRPYPYVHLPVGLTAAVIKRCAPILNRDKSRVFLYHEDMVRISMQQDRVYSSEKAQRLLKFEPRVTYTHGFASTLAWYRRQGRLRKSALDPLSPIVRSLLAIILAYFCIKYLPAIL
eukprot:TRINITY_DN66040_c3_g1_i2.p1 TRINITY_DN66040_c3_g1~~TRINITY_DN66040_c3_g1_i2.p1  ORF type:complete len:386 (+),score=148.43 TRINITY_DN66040_c3_g1_i2:41-1198(+)